jgi:hypothetical protein
MEFNGKSTLSAIGIILTASARLCLGALPDAGLLLDEFPLTLDVGTRTEALGPLYYHQEKESEVMFGVPPLFCHLSDPELDSTEFDLLYPIFSYDRYGREYRWQVLQLLSDSGGQNQEDGVRKRFTLFPIYFQQRSPDTNENYTAVFPIYGHLKNRITGFMRDEIFFVMFPLYSQTHKRDVVTDNYLWPIFHVRHGDSLHGWQFWPLYGEEHKGITTRTNGFGDVETIGAHEKYFALWPIYFNQRTGIGTDNAKTNYAMLPIYSIERSPKRDSTSVIWPLFNYVDDKEKHYHEWESPWPLIVFARGEGKTTTRIWPLYGYASNTNKESDFLLWPVFKHNSLTAGTLERDRMRILLFLYSDMEEKNTETGAERRRVDFWPLWTHRRDFNGNTRLQILAPLEPILPGNKSIERNYSPLWSIWRAEKNPKADSTSQSFLWNLYRRERVKDDKKCSLLFGLFQYQSGTDGKKLKLFYVPLVNTMSRTKDGSTKTNESN